MENKKDEEITVQEFFDLAKDNHIRQYFLAVLKTEGYTENEICQMKMKKALKLFSDGYTVLFKQQLTILADFLKKHPDRIPLAAPHVKKARELIKYAKKLEDKAT